ncbi:MAG: 50S ribosomal protein L10 [Thermobacillus sp.]|jgi:large subunit ribosomal protein L10|uniref:50S ribosomal protein L10 n=1 Tax=Thermobacillus sp. TaxID=2108467 RepID=UPI000E396C33|nr:50S ribosomal protein L10 [Thermobacillus sp.]REK58307.1 MAG: 50S ribosomal protein L10 [Thermobacillus sp.]
MANARIIQEKQQIVDEITTKLRESAATVITDYRGLNVAQVTELRRKLREAGIEFRVLKNTLIRRATANAELTELDSVLTGPTAVAFGKDDVVAPAKILSEFAKQNEALKIKGGVVEGRVVGFDEIKALADLPSREGLLSMLLSVLQAPIRNFALAVKAVADKKEAEA